MRILITSIVLYLWVSMVMTTVMTAEKAVVTILVGIAGVGALKALSYYRKGGR